MAVVGPDFICFGLQKAGTQWLYDQMDSCDQVWMTPIKELNYFVGHMYKRSNAQVIEDFFALDAEKQAADPGRQAFFSMLREGAGRPQDIEWYRKLFAQKGSRISGDISPLYATAENEDVERIHNHCPHTKYILLIRHPVDRIWSALCMHARKGGLEEGALDNWQSVRAVVTHNGYTKRSFPSQIWTRWTSHVPSSAARYWFMDDIVADPDRVRLEILSFCGIDTPQFSRAPNYNRKSSRKKVTMPEDVRSGLYEMFGPEIIRCAEMFGGAAKRWKSA